MLSLRQQFNEKRALCGTSDCPNLSGKVYLVKLISKEITSCSCCLFLVSTPHFGSCDDKEKTEVISWPRYLLEQKEHLCRAS